ncbi:DUF397 domain-containing protein [Streptomyces sp. NPDC058442]|uniref:DUF397 domain-containing protein n=1 Tax=Streptomyces sp. NPDC058442 TaxID=3346503 RepID=UPI0036478064
MQRQPAPQRAEVGARVRGAVRHPACSGPDATRLPGAPREGAGRTTNAEETAYGEANLPWHASSYSTGSGGECVEVALTAGRVHVRDPKRVAQGGPVLKVGSAAWSALFEAM